MDKFVSVVFCKKCGSRFVEVPERSTKEMTVFQCRSCGAFDEIKSFTLGRAKLSESEMQKARDTRAKIGRFEL
jgi:DNA-directed RNA polymerase subunit M/transcription elongation factor TFIIS